MRRWLGGLMLLVCGAAALSQSPPDATAPPKPTQPHQILAQQLMSHKAAKSRVEDVSPWGAKPLVPMSAPPPKSMPLPKLDPVPKLEPLPSAAPDGAPGCPAPSCPAPLAFPPVLSPTNPGTAPTPFPSIDNRFTADFRSALEELKQTRERLEKERKDSASHFDRGPVDPTHAWDLRFRLATLLRRFDERGKQPRPPAVDGKVPGPTTVPPGPVTPPITEPIPTTADPLALAEAQYRSKQHETAWKTLASVKTADLTRRDQAWVQYLKAGCLRQLGKSRDAAVLYREIAAAKDDPFLADMSVWHLSFMTWREQTEAEIEKLRTPEKQP